MVSGFILVWFYFSCVNLSFSFFSSCLYFMFCKLWSSILGACFCCVFSVVVVEIHPLVSPLLFDFASHFLFSCADFFYAVK